jgi:hypothetical protein
MNDFQERQAFLGLSMAKVKEALIYSQMKAGSNREEKEKEKEATNQVARAFALLSSVKREKLARKEAFFFYNWMTQTLAKALKGKPNSSFYNEIKAASDKYLDTKN